MGLFDKLLSAAGHVADAAASTVKVEVKTNLGPAVTLYDGARPNEPGSFSLAGLVGIKASVTVRGPGGDVLYQSAPPPPTEPLKVVLVSALLVGAGYLAWRALRR